MAYTNSISSIETEVYARAISYTKALLEFTEFAKNNMKLGETIEIRDFNPEKLSQKRWMTMTVYSIHPDFVVLAPKRGKKNALQYRTIYEYILKGDFKCQSLTSLNRLEKMAWITHTD